MSYPLQKSPAKEQRLLKRLIRAISDSNPYLSKFINKLHYVLLPAVLLSAYSNANAQAKQTHADSLLLLREKVSAFLKQQSGYRYVYQVALSPDGKTIVYNVGGPEAGTKGIFAAPLKKPDQAVRITASPEFKWSNDNDPTWSADGKHIAFLSDEAKKGQPQLYVSSISNGKFGKAESYSNLNGYVSHPSWSPDNNKISLLYVNNATRAPSPVAAKSKAVGVIDSLGNQDVQQLIVIDLQKKQTLELSPSGLYVFEYDWSPDSKSLVYTASLPPGDDNWYIAKLYSQQLTSPKAEVIYQPSKQIALPRWSLDGKHIAFIEGLMSDQGINSGEIFTINTSGPAGLKNRTPDSKSTPTWLKWQKDGSILFTEHSSGSSVISLLDLSTDKIKRLWQTEDAIHAGREGMSISVAGPTSAPTNALIRSSWNKLPDIWAGSFKQQAQLTYFNKDITIPQLRVENVEWANDGFHVQGWLQYPENYNPALKYPLLVNAHGGPAGVGKPSFNTGIYSQLGYFVFFPNPRGSLGQGAKFTEANRRDWGYGDLRDIISGVDAVRKKVNVDNDRVGLFGWSYGGSTAMFAVTQTNRFRAVVAGAGAADWLSYYGQNSIDQWMKPYFGASPYDDPDAYARSSAMTFIKKAKTPTLILVGELDGESPPAQSFQFWHALKELGTPTQLVVYPDEGHSFFKQEDRVDVIVRTVEWFKKFMPAPESANRVTEKAGK
ncbi:S9 family peptidase [Mucilaginibacter gynuensis]|uniref:S9 family peptidase n=1 Tax=Mucilaginibacter gynuensis TaxID=1302236 RepID=A0ABP8FS30_9SPHI